MSRATSSRLRRLSGLDGLRGVAAAAVVVLHVFFYTDRPGPPWSVADGAVQGLRLGVTMFFVLSGFLLFLPWLRAADGDGSPPSLGRYALKRVARVLPAYYLALAGAAAMLAFTGNPRLPSARQGALITLLLQNWWPEAASKLDPPAWTLCVEASFYLLLPLVGLVTVRWLRSPGRQLAGCAALVLVSVGANRLLSLAGPADWHRTLPGTLYAFALGMGAAALLRRAGALGRPRRALLLLAGLGLVVADALAHVPGELPGIPLWGDLPAALGFAVIVLAVARAERTPLLDAPPVRWIGERSYGLYLWHYPVILLLGDHRLLPGSPAWATLLVLSVSMALAALSWRFVERPIVERARALSRREGRDRRRRRGAQLASPAAA